MNEIEFSPRMTMATPEDVTRMYRILWGKEQPMKFSAHSLKGHKEEKWNSHSIRAAYESGQLENVIISCGKTADTIYGLAPDGEYVGLIVGKNGIIITGFSASLEYWQEQ